MDDPFYTERAQQMANEAMQAQLAALQQVLPAAPEPEAEAMPEEVPAGEAQKRKRKLPAIVEVKKQQDAELTAQLLQAVANHQGGGSASYTGLTGDANPFPMSAATPVACTMMVYFYFHKSLCLSIM